MGVLGKALNIYLHKYDHILLISDFNSEINERLMHDLCSVYNLESQIYNQTHLPVLKTQKTNPVLTFY